MRRVLRAALVGVSACLAGAARAQGDASDLPITYSVPEAPAFTFLGVTSAKVSRASSARDLAAAIVEGIDSTGKVRTGVALGATLWTLIPGLTVSPERYRHLGGYALANAQLSLGTARSSGDSASTDLALGLRTTLFDGSDPLRDARFLSTLRGRLADCNARFAIDSAGSDSALACAGAANRTLRHAWFVANWNRPALSAGAAVGWRFLRSEIDDARALGLTGWLAGAYPLGANTQLVAQLQYDHRARVDTMPGSDVLTYGARIARGASAYDVFLEIVGTGRLRSAPATSRSNAQWTGGIEFEVAPTYWLSTGFGKRYTAAGQPDKVVFLANLRWGISTGPRFTTLARSTNR